MKVQFFLMAARGQLFILLDVCSAGIFMQENDFKVSFNEEILAEIKWKFKEGPLTKNGPIDFAQSWALYLKKSN